MMKTKFTNVTNTGYHSVHMIRAVLFLLAFVILNLLVLIIEPNPSLAFPHYSRPYYTFPGIAYGGTAKSFKCYSIQFSAYFKGTSLDQI